MPVPFSVQSTTESTAPPRKRWTREECAVLENAGLLELRRYELIDGELIQKVGKNHPHSLSLMLVVNWLKHVLDETKVVQEPSIDVSPEDTPTSEPEPDVVVLNRSLRETAPRISPAHVLMIVEVSDSTLSFDLKTKAPLYARAGIAEYWVIDINGRRIIVHRDPVNGQYGSIVAYTEAESVACLAAPGVAVRVGDLL